MLLFYDSKRFYINVILGLFSKAFQPTLKQNLRFHNYSWLLIQDTKIESHNDHLNSKIKKSRFRWRDSVVITVPSLRF